MSDDTEFAYFAGRREGTAAERERIIKLIDDQCECTLPDRWHPDDCTCQNLIALIKGENK